MTEGQINYSAGLQSGGREPAPGELGLVQAFVNTHYDIEGDHGAEILHSPSALGGWLAQRGLLDSPRIEDLTRADLRRAVLVREGLRAMLYANNGTDWNADAVDDLNRAGARPGVVIQFSPDGPLFQPHAGDFDGAIGVLFSITARAQLEGTWERLKACPGDDCGWAFYDYSRNQASAWCSMAVCGQRSKARAYRQRNRRQGDRR